MHLGMMDACRISFATVFRQQGTSCARHGPIATGPCSSMSPSSRRTDRSSLRFDPPQGSLRGSSIKIEGRFPARSGPWTTTAIRALRASMLCVELSDDQCRTLAGVAELRDLAEGAVLVNEGTADSLHLVMRGVPGVVKNADTPEGRTLHTLSSGDFADELGFLDGTPYYASKVALNETRVGRSTVQRSSRCWTWTRSSSIATCARSSASRTVRNGACSCSRTSLPTTSTSSTAGIDAAHFLGRKKAAWVRGRS